MPIPQKNTEIALSLLEKGNFLLVFWHLPTSMCSIKSANTCVVSSVTASYFLIACINSFTLLLDSFFSFSFPISSATKVLSCSFSSSCHHLRIYSRLLFSVLFEVFHTSKTVKIVSSPLIIR